MDWHTSALKDEMPAKNTYSPEAVMILNTHRTPIQKQPEALLCLVGLTRIYYLGDEVHPKFLHDNDWGGLIRAPNPTKVKTGSRPRAAHEVPLLTVTANREIEIEDPATATDSSWVPSTIERSPLNFANKNPSQQSTRPENQEAATPEVLPPENVTTTGVAPEAGQSEGVAAGSPWKSIAAIEFGMGSTRLVPVSQGAPVDVSDLNPLSFADPPSRPSADVTQFRSSNGAATAEDSESENTSFTSMVGSPKIIYRPYGQYNVNLAQQVAMGSQLRLRFEQEAKLLKKYVAQVGRQDKRIQAKENGIKNLETLLEAETNMKKAAENKSAKLSKELENMRALFLDLQVSINRLSQQVSTLQAQVIGEEKLKAAFEEFKQYEDNRVEQRCAEMDARLDALSIDFDEELYPYMLTAIAGIAKGMSEGLKHEVEHGKANLSLEAIEAYDLEVKAKYITALHALKDLKYPIVDQLESLKDAPMDVIMASLHLESNTRDDAPQWIRELCPSSS
nr:hypothetical protein [Tanacetum cinerariifolium]